MEVKTKDAKLIILMRQPDEHRSDTANEEQSRVLKRQKQDLYNRVTELADEIDELK